MRAVIIRNPISGSPQRQFAFARAVETFDKAGWEVVVWVTQRKGHSRDLAARAVHEGFPCIVVAGGDGSIGQTIDGMLHAGGQHVSLGIIPMGTGNVFAREMGLPFPKSPGDDAPARAAQIIIENAPITIDVGKANDRYFLSWAGIGLDAQITEQVEAKLTFKRRAPIISYGITALKTIWSYRPAYSSLTLDDAETLEGRFPLIIAANIQLYARYFRLASDIRLDDGLLDLLVFTHPSKLHLLAAASHMMVRQGQSVPGIIHRKIKHLSLAMSPPQPYHLDGDPLGQTPLQIEVIPRGLRIHLDRKRLLTHPGRLFSQSRHQLETSQRRGEPQEKLHVAL